GAEIRDRLTERGVEELVVRPDHGRGAVPVIVGRPHLPEALAERERWDANTALVEERNDPHLELDRVLRAQVEDPTRPVRLEDRGLQGEVENGASHAAVSSLVSPHHLPLADLRLEVLAPLLALRAAHVEDVRVVSGEPQLDPELDLAAHVVGKDESIGHEAVEELLA